MLLSVIQTFTELNANFGTINDNFSYNFRILALSLQTIFYRKTLIKCRK